MRHGSLCLCLQVILSDGSADSKIRSPLQTRQGESHLGYKAIPVDSFELLASPAFRKKQTLVNNGILQLPTSTGWCTFLQPSTLYDCCCCSCAENQAPHVRNPSDHPQRPNGPPAHSKATWSFAPALALLERVPWLLADRCFWRTVWGVNSLQKNIFKQGSLNGT